MGASTQVSQSDTLGRTSDGDHRMSLQICSHCPICVTQRHPSVYIIPRGKLMCGVQGGMTLQAWWVGESAMWLTLHN
jgi:hypothetical protein